MVQGLSPLFVYWGCLDCVEFPSPQSVPSQECLWCFPKSGWCPSSYPIEYHTDCCAPPLPAHLFKAQESAFRAASEKFTGLSEAALLLSKEKPAALEQARIALEALNEAKANAASTAKELSRMEGQLTKVDQGFSGMNAA